jgi:hypothetical protein
MGSPIFSLSFMNEAGKDAVQSRVLAGVFTPERIAGVLGGERMMYIAETEQKNPSTYISFLDRK